MAKINFDDIYINLQNKQCKEKISKYVQNLTTMFMELIMKKKNLSKDEYLYDSKEYFSINDIENKSEEKKKDIFKIHQDVRNIIIYIISKITEELILLNKNKTQHQIKTIFEKNNQLIQNDKLYIVLYNVLNNIEEMKNEILLFNFKKKILINYQNSFRENIIENIFNTSSKNLKKEKLTKESKTNNGKISKSSNGHNTKISNGKKGKIAPKKKTSKSLSKSLNTQDDSSDESSDESSESSSDESSDESSIESSDESESESSDESESDSNDIENKKTKKTNYMYYQTVIDEFLKLISIKIAFTMYFKRTALLRKEFFIPLLLDIFKNDIFKKKSDSFNFKKMNEYTTEKAKPKKIRNKK